MVFVGRRRRAFAAAGDLGLEVVCVAGTPPGKRTPAVVDFLPCDLDDPGADLAAVAARAAADRRIAAVFALTEGAVLPAARIRRRLGLAGDPPEVATRATDKLEMKRAVSRAGIPCARFVGAEGTGPGELVERLGLPLVVKDRVGSGGRGARLVVRRDELTEPLAPGRLAESFVDGVEMSVESLVAQGRVAFSNPTEYLRVRWANVVPAALEPATLAAVLDLNARAVAAIGVRDAFTHMELFLTPDGPVFGELAARPPGGYITDLIELAYGFDPWRAWLRLGLGEKPAAFPPPARSAGALLLHPGAGVVRRVAGVERARGAPGVERLKLRVEPGAAVAERLGVSQEVGHVLVTGRDRDQVAARLERAGRSLEFEMEAAPEPQKGIDSGLDRAHDRRP